MQVFIDAAKQIFTILKEPVEYMGVRMFVAFMAVAGLGAVVLLLGFGEIELTDTVAVAAIIGLALVAAVGLIGRTVTDLWGKNTKQPEPEDAAVGE